MRSIIFLSLTLAIIKAQSQSLYGFPSPGGYIHNAAGDSGEPYVHDTTGDFGPFYYWKLRQQARKEQERSSGVPKPQPQPGETKRKVVSVRKQVRRPANQQSRFANFQPQSAPTAPAAPARQPEVFQATVRQPQPVQRQQVRQPQPVQRQQVRQPQQPTAPAFSSDPRFAGLRFQFQIKAPEFNYNNNFAENSYAFSSPLYSTTAQGGSYSYSATY